jgi:transposase
MKVYIGIDWSEKKHEICYMHEKGEVLRNLEIEHTMEGFVSLDHARQELGFEAEECIVGLETAHNLLVDYLWDQNYQQVYVLPPNVVKSSQGRYRQSGAKDDRWDARLIADILRTDKNRYSMWQPDSLLTRRIRSIVRLLGHLNKELVRNSNRLRAILLRYHPGILNVFSSLNIPITLAFIQTYPTPGSTEGMSYEEFVRFVRHHHHTQPKSWPGSYNRLQESALVARPDITNIYSPQAVSLTQILDVIVKQKKHWQKELNELYEMHPDRHIYASLPGAGEYLEPALLGKMGDDRQRFPNPKVLQAVAGTSPITLRSGKRKRVLFRWACDREFRHIVQQWAKITINQSPWAEAYYRAVLPHSKKTNDAVRRLANRWLEILWRLWQDRMPYDQAYHLRKHALRSKAR